MFKSLLTVLFFAALSPALTQAAEPYPSKPIRFIVPFPAGSGTDTSSRVLLEDIRLQTGATFIVENRPGALGQIGSDATAKAPADGYTVMMSSSATHSSGPHLMRHVPYDAVEDFTHMARVSTFDMGLFTSAEQPYRTLNDLIEAARAKPDDLTYGFGTTTSQVIAETFLHSAGLSVRPIGYKGQPAALNDLIGGQITLILSDLGLALPHVEAGRLVPMAISAPQRSELLPDTPTFAELGFTDVVLQGWVGIAAPKGVPDEVLQWWARHVVAAVEGQDVSGKIRSRSSNPAPLVGKPMNDMVREQYELWGARIKSAGIEPQ